MLRIKDKACQYVGMLSDIIKMDEKTSEEELIKKVIELNNVILLMEFLIQLPLPKQIDENKVLNLIDPKKDVETVFIY